MNNLLYGKDLVSISDLNQPMLELILQTAEQMKTGPNKPWLSGRVLASCFFEPSTRTRLSFETAVHRLGGELIGFADGGNTSAKKGESLADTIRMIASYSDAIIMRHPREGSARLACEFSTVPIINGGDGANQHPTQTLLDLFSIYECQGRLDNLKIALVGDLKYGRTVHSLAQALSLFGSKLYLISPDALAMPDYLLDELASKGVYYERSANLDSVIPEVDVIYMTRVQKERFDPTEYMHIAGDYNLNADMLSTAQPHLRVLHPLPRVDEVHPSVDATRHAYYFTQAENGVYARMALLSLVMNPSLEGSYNG